MKKGKLARKHGKAKSTRKAANSTKVNRHMSPNPLTEVSKNATIVYSTLPLLTYDLLLAEPKLCRAKIFNQKG